ncbi:hypothetical protein ACFX1X_022654 [Malus domestica]
MTIDVRTHHEIESKRNIPPPPILHHAPYRPRPLLVTGLMTPSKGPLNFKNGAVSSYPLVRIASSWQHEFHVYVYPSPPSPLLSDCKLFSSANPLRHFRSIDSSSS